ncbi:MAG: DUF5680 domain-containing protein [Candidatus Woesearchaeota archaeon]|jgi:hypothetical protein
MLNIKELSEFLVRAKVKTYAGNGKEIKPERYGFRELEYKEGEFEYRDSYSGFYSAPGQEVVRFKGEPIWVMAYSGGMIKKYQSDFEFALKTFDVLKDALKKVDSSKPFRGPENFSKGEFVYESKVVGDVTWFKGFEKVKFKGKVVFSQDYIGGLIVQK